MRIVVGHPRPSHCMGTGVPWVSLPRPTSVPSDAQAGRRREQSANSVREVGASPVVSSASANVYVTYTSVMVFRTVKLKCSCSVTCWNTYNTCSTISAALRAYFIGVSTCLTPDFKCLLITSCSLTVRLLTFSALGSPSLSFSAEASLSTSISPFSPTSALFVVELWLFSQQPPSRRASTAASSAAIVLLFLCCYTSCCFCVAAPQAISCSSAPCLSSRQLSVPLWHLAIFCVDVTSHRFDSPASVSARTWFSLSSHPSPSTPRPSWTCACTRRGHLNLGRAVECSRLRFRASL